MANCRISNGKNELQIARGENPFAAAAQCWRDSSAAFILTGGENDSAALRRELSAADGVLPPIISFPRLLAAAAHAAPEHLLAAARLAAPGASAARRRLAARIYALLREQLPSSAASLPSLSESLAALFEEFIEEYPEVSPPPESLPQLCKKMGEGYQLEADVLTLLWEILCGEDMLAARKTLADFARTAPPLIYAGEEPRRPWMDDFLRRCAGGAAVFEPVLSDNFSENGAPLHETAGNISPPPQECYEAETDSLDGAAKTAFAAILDFAAEEKTVGVAVYDRLLARRLRAVAEAAGVYIEDDGGWRMETLSFGGALRQWTEAAGGFSAAAFSLLLSPPFWADDFRRVLAEEEWRGVLAGSGALPANWGGFSRFSESNFAPFAAAFQTAQQQAPKNAPPAAWVKWLLAHTAAPLAAWKEDALAARLRASLCRAAQDGAPLDGAEFRAWLAQFMRAETGGGEDVQSRICFVSPKTSRRFGGLILLGAHAGNLPPPPDSFLGARGRQMLGLPGRGAHAQRQFAQFCRLLAAHARVAVVRQETDKDGRPIGESPFWKLWKEAQKRNGINIGKIAPPPAPPPAEGIFPPAPPAALLRKWPEKINITAGKHLMQCPYHFYAADILGLGEEDGADDMNPSALGRLLHRGMKQFIETAGAETDEDKLLLHWRETFAALPAPRAGAKLALQHWMLRGEEFVREEAARRAEGWTPRFLEHAVEARLSLGGKVVRFSGRLDRADQNGAQWAVVDYKSGGAPTKTEMQNGEDPQVPLYAFLLGKPLAAWRVCLPAHPGKTRETFGDARKIAARMRRTLRKIAAGAPMPANGAPEVCKKCPSRRLCRRDHWEIPSTEF
ncbi:MAG: RecB family exonuclease [Gammaproteobacteria bacterium]